jgi:hypothetical protein
MRNPSIVLKRWAGLFLRDLRVVISGIQTDYLIYRAEKNVIQL